MKAVTGFAIGFIAWGLTVSGAVQAEPAAIAAAGIESPAAVSAPLDTGAPPEIMAPANPLAAAIRRLLQDWPGTAATETITPLEARVAQEQAAIDAFYAGRGHAPVWVTADGMDTKAASLSAELARAADYGLDPADYVLPKPPAGAAATPEVLAVAETALMRAALTYARHARGGRIMKPSADLSSYLDRAPQLVDPKVTLAELAAAEDPGAVLRALHPSHPQFTMLRERYLALTAGKTGRKGVRGLSLEAKRILANMEQWRWMPVDLGERYVWNNIPEYMLRVIDKEEIVHSERIVAGLISKQTPIFSRPLRKIVFRPKWKVPDSIKVRELWPSLVQGGGLLGYHGLQIETKEGQKVDPASVDWAKTDITTFDVIQPPGPKSVLGVVKFSFPNPHTVFMHDTQDKHLFGATQRTFSHGCMRVRDPLKLAEVILSADKGMDAAAIAELVKSGPLDNDVVLEKRVPVHVTYFTMWVGGDGQVRSFRDVYGHERRIIQALEGRWGEIVKGPDHLAPVEPDLVAAATPRARPLPAHRTAQKTAQSPFDFLGAVFSGGF